MVKRDDTTQLASTGELGLLGDGLFVLVNLAGQVATHPLPESGSVDIGRAESCDICIEHSSISRRHARLTVADRVTIRDLGSANGTKVGDARLARDEERTVGAGDVLRIGAATLLIERGKASRVAPSAVQASRTVAVSSGDTMSEVRALIDKVADSKLSVLIRGETGVGKEVTASLVHDGSSRSRAPFLKLNCAALSASLLESELFGYQRGAFTGAVVAKPGLLETADGGSVFLDEIGDMPLALQAKLLRVLEDGTVMRLGGLQAQTIDVRFIAATNSDLERDIAKGHFRRDLYYRLSGVTITVPPLRERKGEIESLAQCFIEQVSEPDRGPTLHPDAIAKLHGYSWPGNIRELRNVIERAVLLCSGSRIGAEHIALPEDSAPRSPGAEQPSQPVESAKPAAAAASAPAKHLRAEIAEVEKRRIVAALEECGGNQTRAAKLLEISRGTLQSRMDAYGIPRPRKGRSTKK